MEIDNYEKKIQEIINQIKTDLKEQKDGSAWISNLRPKDITFWEDDMVTSIPRVGNKTATTLRDAGITTIKAMATNMELLKSSSIHGISTHLQKNICQIRIVSVCAH